MISVGITAVLGARTDLLQQVVADLADFGTPYISFDNGCRGPYGNFQDCLEWLVANRPADGYLIAQDDVRIAANLRTFLESADVLNERTGVLSPYCAGPHHRNDAGWFKLDPPEGKRAYGACALLLPHHAAVRFLHSPPNKSCRTRTCYWLAEFCKREKLDFWIHSPSLVQHVGTHSLVNSIWDTAEACRQYREAKAWCEDAAAI